MARRRKRTRRHFILFFISFIHRLNPNLFTDLRDGAGLQRWLEDIRAKDDN